VSADEVTLARQALLAASGCARRLERSQRVLAGCFPLTAAAVTTLSPDVEDGVDAFQERFEQLVNILQDAIFKAIAAIGEEDIRPLSRREVAELMERLGALPSAATFRTLSWRSGIESRTCIRTTLNVKPETSTKPTTLSGNSCRRTRQRPEISSATYRRSWSITANGRGSRRVPRCRARIVMSGRYLIRRASSLPSARG
jgi:hypothetical protein